ncbi:uncharacterized protein SPPG_00176 [Spizellomyces punctatus DAOM BR117]|uniref:Mmc1 C-terminal domain-containing protein n=1 Tax=Spizellomyces punctatus (strain DAOM BR117) TaxID=645134 RepID=A0A0L0HTM3_SPIPD|nr:uncharacterized protein SPPG_00176 [Spizellomyces punctatus DAOM BR117]KND04447.1 hypothetical protein SPPG_00176 [Spizellomyces punctatus DAOM BR117]|eukprot:XP_016612486.1 hypothetical protein SPPG_00176 [Spizellomyces punctatus DAOM BR117]
MLSTLGRQCMRSASSRLSVSPSPTVSRLISRKERPRWSGRVVLVNSRNLTTQATPTQPTARKLSAEASSEIQTLLNHIKELQVSIGERDAAWLGRIGVDFDSCFRITVVGERHVGTSALVNALVENPLKESIESSNAGIRRISYGSKVEQVAGATGGYVDVKCPADWLLRNNVEVFELPGLDCIDKHRIEDVIYRTDLIILATDVNRRLTSPSEVQFLENFYANGKGGLVVAVDGLDQESKDKLEVLEEVRSRLRTLAGSNEGPRVSSVVPVSTRKARAAQQLLKDKKPPATFAEQWSASGLQDLKSTVISRLDTPADRGAHKMRAAAFTARRALNRLADSQNATERALNQAREELKHLATRIVETEKRLVRDFETRDLAAVQYSVSSLSDAIHEYFDKVKFWKLFWRSDFVSDDLKSKMRENSLLQAEYQMVYAIGKLNEGLYGLYQRVGESLERLLDLASIDVSAGVARSLQQDISRIGQVLAQQTPPAPGSEVDPFFLRNEIAKFDETRHCDDLQSSAEKLVRRQIGYQLVVYVSGLLGVHLGVPIAVMVPSALGASAGGFGWMKVRWGMLEGRFWGKVSQGHKTLKDNLMTAYDKEFKRVVAEPLVSVIKLLEDAIEARRKEVHDNKKQLEDVLTKVREVERKV